MKIGIFGGSFNPPHRMHLEIGEKMISHGYVDQVIYVPTGKKYPKSELLEDEIRYQMVCLMTEDNPHLEVSDYELQNHLIYTYQT
ncbi:MAG: nicotinic acid mononucleotide adenylyltransferase, partial [Bacilli bacterium]|nr:nicotinic acid mononucleotide adenylyltransferase [Bacilli bacterium]